MSLVYCCKASLFYHAVSCWIDDRSDEESLFVLPSFKSFFNSGPAASPDAEPVHFFMPSTTVLTFQASRALELLPAWIHKNAENHPANSDLIQRVGQLMSDLLSDECWAIKNGLIVYDCLSPEQQRFA